MITMGQLTKFAQGSGCLGKKPFATYADAEVELGRLIRKGWDRKQHGTLAPYFCHRCLTYHLGHFRDKEQ